QVDGNQRIIENKLGQSLTGSIHTPNVRNIPDATIKQSLSSEDLQNIGTRMNLHILGAQTSNIQPDLISKQFADEVHLEASNDQPGNATSSLVDMYLKNTIGNDRYISNPIHQELSSQMSDMIKSQGPDVTAKMITQLRNEGDFNKKLDIKPEQLYQQLGANHNNVINTLQKNGVQYSGFDFQKILKYTGV
ncbi:MAG: hypothetical protein KGI19_09585, partial [Thaumarchaeota archaeon]|nr:hypothetical protein [Nitrososphaerota archaeon]